MHSGVETASHVGHCPINVVYGEQDKSGKNRSKCLVVGSMFPHLWLCTTLYDSLHCFLPNRQTQHVI